MHNFNAIANNDLIKRECHRFHQLQIRVRRDYSVSYHSVCADSITIYAGCIYHIIDPQCILHADNRESRVGSS
ncbi:MAG: hypothetical protein K6356_11575 [Chloroflexus sp.]